MLYFFLRSICRGLFALFYRYQVLGAENIPQKGSAIICPNHISLLDPPLVGSAATRVVHFMAKEELFRIPIFGKLLPKIHAFPVNRQGGGRKALKLAMQVLRENEIVGIFLEGTRSKTGELGKAHVGAALLAIKMDAPVIPTAIVGPYRLFRPVRIVFGTPLDPKQFQNTPNPVQAMTDQVMDEIKKLKQSDMSERSS